MARLSLPPDPIWLFIVRRTYRIAFNCANDGQSVFNRMYEIGECIFRKNDGGTQKMHSIHNRNTTKLNKKIAH